MRTSLGELADYYDAESQVVKAFRVPVPKPKPPKVSPDLIRQRVCQAEGFANTSEDAAVEAAVIGGAVTVLLWTLVREAWELVCPLRAAR